MRTFIRILIFLALSSAIIAASLITYDFIKTRGAFPSKTYIGKIDVSNLTEEEAKAKLKSLPLSQTFTSLITLETDMDRFSFSPGQIGIVLLYKETVKNAFKETHKGNYVDELKERFAEGHFYLPLVLTVDERQLKAVLEVLAPKIRSTSKEASILFYEETGGYHIESEELGRELNIPLSIASFRTALYQGKKNIRLDINFTEPKIMEKDLRAFPPVYKLSAYTTYFGQHDSPGRIHNIKLVASWIDGQLLMPGEKLSVVDILGDVTAEKGYKEALVIVGGELVPLLGGGACQVATTLYNTVAIADLNVLQRRNHSFYFNIYPLGRDAGVYPGSLDFAFENDTEQPILIKAVATNKRLSFRIYGTPQNKEVTFSSAKVLGKEDGEYTPQSLKYVIDNDIPFKTEIVRTVTDKDGQVIKTEKINSYYKLYGDKENVPIRKPEAI